MQCIKYLKWKGEKEVLSNLFSFPFTSLCKEVIVMNHGQKLFQGDVETGVNRYLGVANKNMSAEFISYAQSTRLDQNQAQKSETKKIYELPQHLAVLLTK